MKNVFIILLLISFTASAQPGYNQFTSRNHWYGGKFHAFHVPAGAYPSLAIGQWNGDGAIRFDSVHRRLYYYYNGGWYGLADTTELSGTTTLQQAIINSGAITQNSTISLPGGDLFIGDNIGTEWKNSTSTLELFGPAILFNRGWSGAGGLAGLPSGASTDSVLTINQATGQVYMRSASLFTGTGEANTASNLGGGLANFSVKSGVDLRFNSFAGNDFNMSSNIFTIDWVNNQKATTSQNGALSSTDWNTFNNKVGTSTTNTLTNKRWTARVGTTTSSATPTINTDNTDIYKLTAQAANITSFTTNLSGTPVDGDILEIQITGTAARTISWGASFAASTIALPTTTVSTNTLTTIFQFYTTSSYGNSIWVCANSY